MKPNTHLGVLKYPSTLRSLMPHPTRRYFRMAEKQHVNGGATSIGDWHGYRHGDDTSLPPIRGSPEVALRPYWWWARQSVRLTSLPENLRSPEVIQRTWWKWEDPVVGKLNRKLGALQVPITLYMERVPIEWTHPHVLILTPDCKITGTRKKERN